MNIEFRVIDKSNYNQCIKLKTSEEQKKFVATNIFSLVQSAYEPNFYPLGVYKNDKMVGFILYDFDDEINGWSMSRFMIDEKFQNQGIGKVALNKFIKFFIEKYGHIKLYTSAEVDNTIAINLYESMGFEKKEVFEYEVDGVIYKEFRMLAQL
ncbi:GNAT family N-acetyltransferase [Romboutsia sedimentorum]|uniref:GNAT family N-acetyltransferase n=1 Tax=Romboutsia sedimentorum TaxID=1368474 RepID=UPI0024DECD1E|nr:GNAT family N-acetyltransferase [Romboutsia sedimentorum]MDK2584636.1 GNAT family N-acetyltransferase [Romboutsia sedimentorum]